VYPKSEIQGEREKMKQEKSSTEELRDCYYCGKRHPTFYFFTDGGQKHFKMMCGRVWRHLPFEEGLNIPIRKSKKLQQIEAAERQLDFSECDAARDRDRT